MNISLKFGLQKISLNFPESARILNTREPEFNIKKDSFFTKFKSLLRGKYGNFDKIAIVVSDKTRLCDYPIYLPWLTEILLNKGAKEENITFYIAYGTHSKQTDSESLASYGNIFKEYSFVHHDCNDFDVFKNIGTTKRGTDILVRKDLLASSLIITFGPISHHYFAGFGGGRKLLFPGLGEKNAIYHNHSLFLDTENKKLNASCQPGELEGNPVAEDLKEIDHSWPPRLSIFGILNSKGKLNQIYFGKTYTDFVKVCETYNTYYKSKTQKQFDLVIASSGGYPKDINFIQAHKSIHHASAFVKNGGKLIILSKCRDGIGNPSFLELFETKENQDILFEKLSQKYEGNGGTALAMKEKTNRIQIFALTRLDEKECQLLGMKKIDLKEIKNIIKNGNGSIAVIPNASMLIK